MVATRGEGVEVWPETGQDLLVMQSMLVHRARQTFLVGNRVSQPRRACRIQPKLPRLRHGLPLLASFFLRTGCTLAATEGTTMRCSRAFGLCVLLAVGQAAWAQGPSVRLGKPQAIGATQTSNYAPPADSGPVPSLYPNLLQADFAPALPRVASCKRRLKISLRPLRLFRQRQPSACPLPAATPTTAAW